MSHKSSFLSHVCDLIQIEIKIRELIKVSNYVLIIMKNRTKKLSHIAKMEREKCVKEVMVEDL